MEGLPLDQPKSEPLSQADYEALANLRYALRQFTAFSSTEAQAAGLPPQQHQALLAIKGHAQEHQMTIGALAERLLIAPQTATELVNRLAEAGLVDRMTDPNDRRRHGLALTGKAEALLKPLSIVHLHKLRLMAPALIEILRAFCD
jgi:DNA-binding MarR family transcriptional regulator